MAPDHGCRRRPGSPTRPGTCGATSPAFAATPTRRPSRQSCGRRSTPALAAGIDVTHLDAHMGAALAPELGDIYLRLGVDYRLPVLLTGSLAGYGPSNHLADVTEEQYAALRRPGAPARTADLRRGARDAVGPAGDSHAVRRRRRWADLLRPPPERAG